MSDAATLLGGGALILTDERHMDALGALMAGR